MGSGVTVNRQTTVGLLMFLTHEQPRPPVQHSDSSSNKPAAAPEHASDKSAPAPDVVPIDKSPHVTLPPWYEEDEDKGAAKDPSSGQGTPHGTGAEKSPGKGSSSSSKSSSQKKPAPSPPEDRPLILYAFAESAPALENLEFFVKQGLHDEADFVFILNGETNASSVIPDKKNIKIVKRPNTCFDLGAYGEVLRENNLYKKYKRFITMNASIRGPFLPHWATSCWSDLYLGRITDKVKLVGMTGNCWPRFHVQSMIWATDAVGIDMLLNPPPGSSEVDQFGGEEDLVGLAGCYDGWNPAVHAEIGATGIFLKQGYKVDLMMSAFHKSENYIEECDPSQNGDVLWNGKYFGTNVHPFETLFIKANRDIDPTLIGHLTTWQLASGYSSYKACAKS